MRRKNYFVRPPEMAIDTATFEGFDIAINPNDAQRIDRLVDEYESSIISHLNEEYVRKTSWSD